MIRQLLPAPAVLINLLCLHLYDNVRLPLPEWPGASWHSIARLEMPRRRVRA